jgi:ribosome maturation factor RimP
LGATDNLGLVDRITQLSEQAATGTPIEIVEVQLRGAGSNRLLRVYIDKPNGVTHGDCELVSERLGRLLDEEDVIPGDGYTLEVSSPGLERKLTKARDFERVVGQRIKLTTLEPVNGRTSLEGRLEQVANGNLALELGPDAKVEVPIDRIRKANLKFEW